MTGVDFAPRAIKLARQKTGNAGIQAELLVRDASNLRGIDGPFDLAFDLGCFHSIPQDGKKKYLGELDRVLASGGFWLLYAFLKTDAAQPGTGLAETDIDSISAQLTLISRQDGFDRRGPSAWFLFQNQ